jgi:hypothetical protein
MALNGNEPFWLFLGVVALLAAVALIRKALRGSRPGAMRWGREGADLRDRWGRANAPVPGENDSSRGPGSTDSGASDNET